MPSNLLKSAFPKVYIKPAVNALKIKLLEPKYYNSYSPNYF